MRNLLERMDELTYLSEHMVEIGILGIDKNLKGKDGKTTILEYAVYNEFGTKSIPPRPFMRKTLEKDGSSISKYIDERMEKVFDGEISGRQALQQIGEFIRGKIMENILTANSWATPLDSKTLKRKLKKGGNNNKILIDERFLIKSIRYQIISKTGEKVFVSDFKEV